MTLGEKARKRANNLNRIGRWGGLILSNDEKKVKYHGVVCPYMNDFQLKINTRQKSGNAVACASVAPVQLHHLVHHQGTNTW